ncbi:LytR C-terminal domain-containing protein [Pseudoduganella violacea]|uniref:Tetratricopeptide (TPR) repeat protein n=1 Tax=Pseudoduganella violacea TaxID=1715466 RepID=A0A7W5B5L0_9BURK|nr:tetratricopeptide repeat protein [Pseudoduganella violacea]MBB3116999.1 tetratricopeptide (TPR) repeat protein [Pseudoduganella violacea]
MNTRTTCCSAMALAAMLLACSSAPPPLVEVAPPAGIGADGYYALGRSEHEAHHAPQARRAYGLALQIDPRHAHARNGLAVLLAEQGDYDGAIAQWRALLEDEPQLPLQDSALLLANLAYAYYLKNDAEAALQLLEKVCALQPANAQNWEKLAALLERTGQSARALQMMRQARMLRQHDIGQDYALARGSVPATALPAAVAGLASAWPELAEKTELHAVGPALVEVRRVPLQPAQAAQPAAAMPAAMPAAAAGVQARAEERPAAVLRLEISNGNGVQGMAAAMARRLRGNGVEVVRLSNVRPFAVRQTHIEYGEGRREAVAVLERRVGRGELPQAQQAPAQSKRVDIRLVLGRDLSAAPEIKKPSGPAGRQAP